jgi:hypothetical protein
MRWLRRQPAARLSALNLGVMCTDKTMKEISRIKLEVFIWSFVLNPGAVILGLCMYSLVLPDELAKRKKHLRENT